MGSISTRIDTDFNYSKKPSDEICGVAPVEVDVEVDDDPTVLEPEFGASVEVDVEVDDDPTVLEPEFGASVIEDEDPVEVEVDDDPTVDEPVFGADVKDKAPVEVDDDPTVDEPVLGAGDTGILTSWVATEEPKKGKGGKKKKN